MKLNLVASYLLPDGGHFSAVHAIDRTNNLISLNEMTSLTFPKAGGGFLRVAPSVLMICPSARQARRCADNWNAGDDANGRLWHGEEIANCESAKKRIVWTVCEGDTGCDEPGYVATCSVFATREAAVRSIEKAVAEAEDCFDTPAKWNAERDMAIIARGDGRQIVYTINEEEVRA